MNDYVSRKKVIEITHEVENKAKAAARNVDMTDVRLQINMLPDADVKEVVYANLITHKTFESLVTCSNCGYIAGIEDVEEEKWNYCPVCGAKIL